MIPGDEKSGPHLRREQPHTNFFSIEGSVYLNPQFSHHVVYTGNLIDPKEIANELYFQFQIKPLTSIRLLGENGKAVLKLTLGDLQLKVKVVKDADDYIFEEGVYRNYMVAQLVYEGLPALELGRKEVKLDEWTSLLVTIEKTVEFDKKVKWNLETCYPVLQIGSLAADRLFECKLKGIKLVREKQTGTGVKDKSGKLETQLQDGPLDTVPKSKVPDVNALPKYESPQDKPDKLYLCHDMAGGYNQDMNRHHPYPQEKSNYLANKAHEHTYRSLHLAQASIFNYFSHQLISVPPKHWRRLCKASKTKCLGTYIVEKDTPGEEEYLSDQAIKVLVYLARLYKFDGYLINFEHQIKNMSMILVIWLRKLTQAMHEAVPGSQIIWYDSVIKNGNVSYQNEVNEHNSLFYKACDGIFLNYWWNEEKLAKSLMNKIEKKTIYVGSDCFGRGTFAGGGYNTYKAVQAIRKADQGSGVLVPALFAMGYSYEMDKASIESWKINQKCLYRGLYQFKQEIPHDNWQYFDQSVNGFTWQFQDGWAVTSFRKCRRSASFKLKKLLQKCQQENTSEFIITFFTTLMGTGPKFEDPYRISMVLSLDGTILNQTTTGNRVASDKEEIVEVKLNVDCDLVTESTIVSVIEEGQDAEKWGGHFGTRFKNDSLYIIGYNKDNDWIARYKTNFPHGVSLPYLTFYNLGHGHHFRLKGKEFKKSYDFMSDSDINYTYIMNPPMNVSIHYKDSYMGGTCLLVQNGKKLKLIQVCPGKQRHICCRIIVKNVNQEEIKFKLSFKKSNEVEEAKLQGENSVENGWSIYQFRIDLPEPKETNQKVILYLESNANGKYLLGQTAVYPKESKLVLPSIQSLKLQISEHNPPISPIFLNATLKMSNPCRILLTFGKQFACFGWADELNGQRIQIKNISGNPGVKNQLKVMVLDAQLTFKEIFAGDVDTKALQYQIEQQII